MIKPGTYQTVCGERVEIFHIANSSRIVFPALGIIRDKNDQERIMRWNPHNGVAMSQLRADDIDLHTTRYLVADGDVILDFFKQSDAIDKCCENAGGASGTFLEVEMDGRQFISANLIRVTDMDAEDEEPTNGAQQEVAPEK